MPVITRFAPSPTGLLHVGNARTALINWLYTRSHNQDGKVILRIDDTDVERSKKEYELKIIEDLKWLGLDWDEKFNQSDRFDRYEEAKHHLIKTGRLYPCYETVEELALKRKIQLSNNMPPIYDRASLKLTDKQKAELEASGIKPHWRFLMKEGTINWNDKIRGEMSFNAANLSDPIIERADGTKTYTLCSVVDDIDYSITNIIRGEDHIANSATHIQIFEALDAPHIPTFAHLSLLTAKGAEISKRIGGFDIESLKAHGIEPMAINSMLAKMGTSDPIEYRMHIQELINEFSFKKFGKASVTYDIDDLKRLNSKIVRNLDYDDVKDRLNAKGMGDITKNFWDVVKRNINTVDEIQEWWIICNMKVEPKIINLEFTTMSASLLPKGVEWDENTWNNWLTEVKKHTDLKNKELFSPIRLALTGLEHGPELKFLLPLIGYDKAFARLTGNAA